MLRWLDGGELAQVSQARRVLRSVRHPLHTIAMSSAVVSRKTFFVHSDRQGNKTTSTRHESKSESNPPREESLDVLTSHAAQVV